MVSLFGLYHFFYLFKVLAHLLGKDVLVVLDAFVPHRFEDGGKGSHSNSCAHQHNHLVTKHVLTGSTKRAIYGHPENKIYTK